MNNSCWPAAPPFILSPSAKSPVTLPNGWRNYGRTWASMTTTANNQQTLEERKRPILAKSLKRSIGLRQLDHALQATEFLRQGDIVRRLMKVQQDAYAKKVGVDPPSQEADDNEMIQVGDNEIHIHQSPEPEQPAPSQPSQPPAQPPAQETKDGVPTWAKAALVAAGLVGAGGLGAAVPWMLGAYGGDTTTTTNISQGEQQLGVDVVKGGALK